MNEDLHPIPISMIDDKTLRRLKSLDFSGDGPHKDNLRAMLESMFEAGAKGTIVSDHCLELDDEDLGFAAGELREDEPQKDNS